MAFRLCHLVACRVLEILGSRRRTALDKDIVWVPKPPSKRMTCGYYAGGLEDRIGTC
jgi:hypothetical protein